MPFKEGKREGNVACPPGTGTCLMLVVPRWSDRGASLSGRGQWACASRRTCKLEWRSAEPTEKRKLIAKPPRSHCSSTLPAHFDAHSSSKLCRVFSWIHEYFRASDHRALSI